MRVILVDPVAKTVTEHDIPRSGGGFLEEAYKLTGCSCITVAQYDSDHDVYVDDEGLLKQVEGFVMVPRHPEPLAGKALIVGAVDDEGENTPATVDLDHVKKSVSMINFEHVIRLIRP